MSVKPSSRSSYLSHVVSGRARYQREIIMDLMGSHQLPRNRREISVLTGLPINAVTGRVNALIKSNQLIEQHFCVDPQTNNRVGYVELPTEVKVWSSPRLKQGTLF